MPGGKFLYSVHGNVAEVLQAAPRTQKAKVWCEQYGTPRLASFTLSKYGENVASALALFWCRKMQFLLALWEHQDDMDYVYRPEDVEAANDDSEFEEGWKDLPATHPCWGRGEGHQGHLAHLDGP